MGYGARSRARSHDLHGDPSSRPFQNTELLFRVVGAARPPHDTGDVVLGDVAVLTVLSHQPRARAAASTRGCEARGASVHGAELLRDLIPSRALARALTDGGETPRAPCGCAWPRREAPVHATPTTGCLLASVPHYRGRARVAVTTPSAAPRPLGARRAINGTRKVAGFLVAFAVHGWELRPNLGDHLPKPPHLRAVLCEVTGIERAGDGAGFGVARKGRHGSEDSAPVTRTVVPVTTLS